MWSDSLTIYDPVQEISDRLDAESEGVMSAGDGRSKLCDYEHEMSVLAQLEDYEKTIEAQQQEIEELKNQNDTLSTTVNMFAPYIIGKKESEVVEELKELLTLKQQNAALTADKDEQAFKIMQMDFLLKRVLPILEVANDQQDLIIAINALLGGKEDV